MYHMSFHCLRLLLLTGAESLATEMVQVNHNMHAIVSICLSVCLFTFIFSYSPKYSVLQIPAQDQQAKPQAMQATKIFHFKNFMPISQFRNDRSIQYLADLDEKETESKKYKDSISTATE